MSARRGPWLALLPVVLALAIGASYALRRAPGRTSTPPAAPVRPPPAPVDVAPPPSEPDEDAPGGVLVRVKRAGRVEERPESAEFARERERRIEEARERFEAFREEFRKLSEAKFKEGGPLAALQFLEAYLRNPSAELRDQAFVCEAIVGLVSLAQEERPARERLGALLRDAALQDEVARVALLCLGNRWVSVDFRGGDLVQEGGVWSYDADAPLTAFLLAQPPRGARRPPPKPGEPFADASLVEAVLALARDESRGVIVRTAALAALEPVADVVPRAELARWARGSDRAQLQVALRLLSFSPEPVTPAEFWSLAAAQEHPLGRANVYRELGPSALGTPESRSELARVLARPVPSGKAGAREAVARGTLVDAALEAYAAKRDPALLSLLGEGLQAWARDPAPENTQAAALARGAARLNLRDFAPYLRAARDAATEPGRRTSLSQALAALER